MKTNHGNCLPKASGVSRIWNSTTVVTAISTKVVRSYGILILEKQLFKGFLVLEDLSIIPQKIKDSLKNPLKSLNTWLPSYLRIFGFKEFFILDLSKKFFLIVLDFEDKVDDSHVWRGPRGNPKYVLRMWRIFVSRDCSDYSYGVSNPWNSTCFW